jgi:hypothetical protein
MEAVWVLSALFQSLHIELVVMIHYATDVLKRESREEKRDEWSREERRVENEEEIEMEDKGGVERRGEVRIIENRSRNRSTHCTLLRSTVKRILNNKQAQLSLLQHYPGKLFKSSNLISLGVSESSSTSLIVNTFWCDPREHVEQEEIRG